MSWPRGRAVVGARPSRRVLRSSLSAAGAGRRADLASLRALDGCGTKTGSGHNRVLARVSRVTASVRRGSQGCSIGIWFVRRTSQL